MSRPIATLFRTPARALALLLCVLPLAASATMVRLNTVLGPIDITLYDAEAPKTVTNFLAYVKRAAYTDSFFHRSVPGFVVQGGGYWWDRSVESGNIKSVVTMAPVQNEFNAARSNRRGTVAMAKLGGDPNSATSQWFVNLVNNGGNLDSQNGGFTVFGKVTTPGMLVVDAIAARQVVNAGSPFDALPVMSVPTTKWTADNLVMVESAVVMPEPATLSDSDRIFNYLEAAYPQYVAPANAVSTTIEGYYVRYYARTNAYVGTANGNVYYLVPAISNEIQLLGSMADWLGLAVGAGY